MRIDTLSARLLLSMLASPAAAQDSFFDGVLDLSNLNGSNGFVISGTDASDRLGDSVSSAGDVNGDGFVDLIVGAPGGDPGGVSGAGESYVVFGGLGIGFGGSIDLTGLNGGNGFVLNGIDQTDGSGSAVSGAGDVNGDGFADLIIGASTANPVDDAVSGEGYVVFGGDGIGAGGSVELGGLNGTNGFLLNRLGVFGELGASVSGAGDVNRDGFSDVIIGSPNSALGAGESFVVFGGAGVGSSGSVGLGSLNGADGFVLTGIDSSDLSGLSVGDAGDVNGDGFGDLIVGAPFANQNGTNVGESYVIFGGAGVGSTGAIGLGGLNPSTGFVINGAVNDASGRSVSSAGDINGDGFDDLIIGSGSSGEPFVVFGGPGLSSVGTIDRAGLNGSNGFSISGIGLGSPSQIAVSGAGDINGDGIDDLIVGANVANGSRGRSYVIFGGTGIGSSGTFAVSSLIGTNGFVINGIDPGDNSGSSVSGAGDINGDGIDDLIVGANAANGFTGQSYVIFGASGFTWTSLTGGSFDASGNWLGGVTPGANGVGTVVLAPDFGGSVTGSSSTVVVNRFTLGAIVGTTTFQFGAGDLISRQSITILSNGRVVGPSSGNVTLATAGELNNAGEIVLSGELSVSAQTIRNSGALRGAGRLSGVVTNTGRVEVIDQAGEMSFTDAVTNDTSGLVALQSSTVRFAQGIDNRGQISVATAGTLLGDVTNTGTIGLAGGTTLSLVGSLEQNGAANLLAGSKLTVFGDFTGAGGTSGTGTLEVLGTTSVGNSPAEVGIGGDLLLGAAMVIELGGTGTGEFDRLVVGGDINLNGDLVFKLIDGFLPAFGDTFEIVTAASISGSFETVALPGASYELLHTPTSVRLLATSGLSGDYNNDGTVDAADYSVWRDNLGAPAGTLLNDADGGVIDTDQYLTWRANFGSAVSSSAADAVNVPEPSASLTFLLGLAAMGFGASQRQRSRLDESAGRAAVAGRGAPARTARPSASEPRRAGPGQRRAALFLKVTPSRFSALWTVPTQTATPRRSRSSRSDASGCSSTNSRRRSTCSASFGLGPVLPRRAVISPVSSRRFSRL